MFIPGEGTDSCQDCRCTRSVHCCYTSSDNLIEYRVIQLYNSIKLYWLFRHARGQQFKMKNKNLMSFEWELLPGDSWALGQGLNAGLAAGDCLSGAAGWRGGCRETRGPLRGTSSADPSCRQQQVSSGSHNISQTTESQRYSDTAPRPPTLGGRL